VLFALDSKGVGEAIGGAICAVLSLILILTVLAIGCAVIYHLTHPDASTFPSVPSAVHTQAQPHDFAPKAELVNASPDYAPRAELVSLPVRRATLVRLPANPF
jgi:hypothetical protein